MKFFFLLPSSHQHRSALYGQTLQSTNNIGDSRAGPKGAKKKEGMFIALGNFPTFAFYTFFIVFLMDGCCTLHIDDILIEDFHGFSLSNRHTMINNAMINGTSFLLLSVRLPNGEYNYVYVQSSCSI